MPRGHRKTDALAPLSETAVAPAPDLAQLGLQTREAIQALLTPKVEPDSPWLTIAQHISAFHQHDLDSKHHGGPKGYLAQPSTIAALLELCERGLSPTMAATRCGISPAVITQWQDKAKHAPDGPYGAMMAALKAANEQLRMKLLEGIQRAGTKDQHWTALGWHLERAPQFNGDYKLAEAQRNQGVTIIIGVQGERVTVGESHDTGPSVSHPTNLPIIDIPSKS